MQPVIYSMLKAVCRKEVRRTGRGYGKQFLGPMHHLGNIERNNYFNSETRFNGVFSRNNLPRIKYGV